MSDRGVWRVAWGLVAAVTVIGMAAAKPFVPDDDSLVLEQLPERTDPSLKELRRMRSALAANPRDLDAAARVAQRAIEAARSTGDPRLYGQAQAALAPWWNERDAPPRALLLRATVKQGVHDFNGALNDLDRALAAAPGDPQTLLTRATLLTVLGRYADARRDCAALSARATPLVTTTCSSAPQSLSGGASDAYRSLTQALARGTDPPGIRAWALTLAAEIAARRGDGPAAENHFRQALALDSDDVYLRAAYADFLLDQGRPRDVLPLARDRTSNDALLLRLTLAEAALPDERESFLRHRYELTARFAAARARGDALHRREEARFLLMLDHDPRGALELARENWATQREPADLRILADAARASGDAAALAVVADWLSTTRLEDVALAGVARAGAR